MQIHGVLRGLDANRHEVGPSPSVSAPRADMHITSCLVCPPGSTQDHESRMRMYNCTGRAVWTGQTGDGKQCTGVLEQLLSLACYTTRRMVCCCTQCKPTAVLLYGCMELVNDQISPKMCCHESCNGNRHLSPEDTRDRHYYRIGLCYKLFVPVAFGSETIGGFCPGSKG